MCAERRADDGLKPAILGDGRLTTHDALRIRTHRVTYVYMSTTITIRTDEALRRALGRRARAQGKTISEVAREILRNALEQSSLGPLTGHLRGRLSLPRNQTEPWRQTLRQRNWRP